MNFQENFRPIGDVDVAELRDRVLAIADERWLADLLADRRGEGNGSLQTLALVFDPDLRHSHPTRLPPLSDFETLLLPVLKNVADYFEGSERGQSLTGKFGLGYFVRAVFERLPPGQMLATPASKDFSPTHSHQVMVPVVTNAGVEIAIAGEAMHVPAGSVVETNNRRQQVVSNTGDAVCIHLVLDFVLPGEQCCCGAQRHPDTVCSPAACRETDQFIVACDCCAEH